MRRDRGRISWASSPQVGSEQRHNSVQTRKPYKSWDRAKVELLQGRIKDLRSRVMDALLCCLWDNSKRTRQWELAFTNQLTDVTNLLKGICGTPQMTPQETSLVDKLGEWQSTAESATAHEDGSSGSDMPRRPGVSEQKKSQILQALTSAAEHTPLFKLADDVIRALSEGSVSTKEICRELMQVLWQPDWKLDKSMAELSVQRGLPKLDEKGIALRMAERLRFEAFQAREAAISESFAQTYSWVFDREPREGNGKPLWSSFPNWLESHSDATYWITGRPGSGKSTMMKFISGHSSARKHLNRWAGDLPLLVTTYYAWNAGLTLQKSFEGLKRTLLFQALTGHQELMPILAPRRWALYQAVRSVSMFPPWEAAEIEESFDALLSVCGKAIRLVLFIDGLDEFEIPARDVVSLTNSLTSASVDGIKVCVASRPWTEFDDAYHNFPSLQMHVLTWQDMSTFVADTFSTSRAFGELEHIYPQEAARLRGGIVQKSNGIFIWVSIVVDALVSAATEGCSIYELQDILDSLPNDIRSLYDALWARIPMHNQNAGSCMIQLAYAAPWPLEWFMMWYADEIRSTGQQAQHTLNDMLLGEEWTSWAQSSLKRRLASRTRGILEVTSGDEGYVNFIHRTAREWLTQPEVWERICLVGERGFEPCLFLLQAETTKVSHFRSQVIEQTKFWSTVTKALWYASQTTDNVETTPHLVQALDVFDIEALECQIWIQTGTLREDQFDMGPNHWSGGQDGMRGNTFLGLAAQFSILPYIKAKTHERRSLLSQKSPKHTVGILENAVLGFEYYMPDTVRQAGIRPKIPHAQRLQTVHFLLDQGVEQSKMYTANIRGREVKWKTSTLIQTIMSISQTSAYQENKEYYHQVMECLSRRGSRRLLKSASLRLRSLLGD
ncbi:hypothetical protein GQ53DRAFT_884669 [Thozetella sp. PMI_491]|nr:hypothetical protein GQ53DRAFT_884669 [Thozetella sp. PMI_491]